MKRRDTKQTWLSGPKDAHWGRFHHTGIGGVVNMGSRVYNLGRITIITLWRTRPQTAPTLRQFHVGAEAVFYVPSDTAAAAG